MGGILIALGFGLTIRKTFRTALEPTATTVPATGPEAPPSAVPVAAATPVPPSNLDFEKGRKLLDKGDATGALRLLTPLAQATDDALVAHTYARALWATGSRDRAIIQFERAARLDPRTPTYRVDLGRSLASLRRSREAIREYEAAVSLDPGNADNVLALAALYSRSGNAAESRILLQRASVLRPGDAEITRRIAELDAAAPSAPAPSLAIAPAASVPIASATAPPATLVSPGIARPSPSGPPPPGAPSASSSGVVYTEDDLRRAGAGRTRGAVPVQSSPATVRPTPDGAAPSALDDAARWRQRIAERRSAVRAAQRRLDAARAQIEDLRRQVEGAADDAQRSERQGWLARAADEADAAQEGLASAQRRLEELEDEARRNGVPPDGIR